MFNGDVPSAGIIMLTKAAVTCEHFHCCKIRRGVSRGKCCYERLATTV